MRKPCLFKFLFQILEWENQVCCKFLFQILGFISYRVAVGCSYSSFLPLFRFWRIGFRRKPSSSCMSIRIHSSPFTILPSWHKTWNCEPVTLQLDCFCCKIREKFYFYKVYANVIMMKNCGWWGALQNPLPPHPLLQLFILQYKGIESLSKTMIF